MSQVTLHYFDGRGKGEIIRFMLSAAGIKFNEVFLTKREEMVKLITDGLLDFNQLPLLDIDGLRLVQTGAIVRYIARRGGLYGKDDKEAAVVDKFFEGQRISTTTTSPWEHLHINSARKNNGIKCFHVCLQQFYKTVSSLPNISAFLKGPQRKRANDERYVADVKRVLAW
ncbi:glutathione S-transferase 3-like [Liolophura sinensis]|uniref:glutathione S-transferase 3-like n=1 Tax=Liolophura sinensis TaxID=3198878 RepID=UPI0031584177